MTLHRPRVGSESDGWDQHDDGTDGSNAGNHTASQAHLPGTVIRTTANCSAA
jgi:hypothetical protein